MKQRIVRRYDKKSKVLAYRLLGCLTQKDKFILGWLLIKCYNKKKKSA